MSKYASLLSSNKPLVFSALIARLPAAIIPLAMILFAQQISGSFQFAGWVGAALALGALLSPFQGRLLDLWGPRYVFPVVAVVSLPLFLFLASWDFSHSLSWALIPIAFALTALQPAITSYMRSYWRRSIEDDSLVLAGNALETGLVRTLSVCGPLLVSLGLLLGNLQAMFAVCGLFVVSGSFLVAFQADTITACRNKAGKRMRFSKPVLYVLSFVLVSGWSIGVMELLIPLVSMNGSLSPGILFAFLGMGSLIGALWSGSRDWKYDHRQVVYFLTLASVPVIILAAWSGPFLPTLLLLFGILGAIAGNHLLTFLGKVVPKGNLSEAYTWSLATTVVGLALGHMVAGIVADNYSDTTMFLLSALPTSLLLAFLSWQLRKNFFWSDK